MARKPRIHFRGAVYHVILNGVDEQTIFKSASDRNYCLGLLADGLSRFGHKLHAYCLDRNSVQLAIEVDTTPLSKIMQNLSFRYTRSFNSKHKRKGALFHGRYKAVVIDAEHYLNDLVRYIHNSPVRKRRAADAASGKWTSHAAYTGLVEKPDWLTTSDVLSSFHRNNAKARLAFSQFVDAGKDEGERLDLMRGSSGVRVLGNSRFTKKALKPAKSVDAPITLSQLVKRVCREEGIKEAQLLDESRARRESQVRQTIAYLATELNIATLTATSKRFNRDLTTMSRNQRYYRQKLAEDPTMQKHVRSLRRRILQR